MTFSRPLSSGFNPVPSSSRLSTRPCTSNVPVVGYIAPLRILSSVLLPEPLTPMTPSDSPRRTVSETSRSAQKSSCRTTRPPLSHSTSRPDGRG